MRGVGLKIYLYTLKNKGFTKVDLQKGGDACHWTEWLIDVCGFQNTSEDIPFLKQVFLVWMKKERAAFGCLEKFQTVSSFSFSQPPVFQGGNPGLFLRHFSKARIIFS